MPRLLRDLDQDKFPPRRPKYCYTYNVPWWVVAISVFLFPFAMIGLFLCTQLIRNYYSGAEPPNPQNSLVNQPVK